MAVESKTLYNKLRKIINTHLNWVFQWQTTKRFHGKLAQVFNILKRFEEVVRSWELDG